MYSSNLLTSDQRGKLKKYVAPLGHLESTVPHLHTRFQHLIPIKVTCLFLS